VALALAAAIGVRSDPKGRFEHGFEQFKAFEAVREAVREGMIWIEQKLARSTDLQAGGKEPYGRPGIAKRRKAPPDKLDSTAGVWRAHRPPASIRHREPDRAETR